MIKNKNQLVKAQQLLREARTEINEVGNQYSGTEKEILLIPLERERDRLVSEIEEYNDITDNSLETLVAKILSKPVTIGNIGPLLTKLRMASDLTQAELAKKIGWEQANLSRFEGENYSSQTVAKIVQYASALGVYIHVSPSLSEQPAELEEVGPEIESILADSIINMSQLWSVRLADSMQPQNTTDRDYLGLVVDIDQHVFKHQGLFGLSPEAIESST